MCTNEYTPGLTVVGDVVVVVPVHKGWRTCISQLRGRPLKAPEHMCTGNPGPTVAPADPRSSNTGDIYLHS